VTRPRPRLRLAAVAAVAGLAACSPLTADFLCTDDASCVSASGAQGTCEPTRRCSLPDTTCASGKRYADASGPLADRCTTAFDCIADVRAGDRATCARKTDGSIWCWGDGSETPERLALPSAAAQFDLGGAGICARLSTGEVYCAPGVHQPLAQIPQLISLDLSVGGSHACAVTTDHRVACWGANNRGQLGDGSTTARTAPVVAGGGLSTARQVSAGVETTCAVSESGAVWCWGSDEQDQLGRGICPFCDDSEPMTVESGMPAVATVTVADRFVCALTTTGAVYCWGANDRGQLGDRGVDGTSDAPHQVPALTGATQITTGGGHACAIAAAGAASCWGDNRARESTSAAADALRAVTPVTDRATQPLHLAQIDAGTSHTCGRSSDGLILCWGDNASGEIGDGTVAPAALPAAALLICP
jgi:alpha-tubulin suppressor-like RCC1 family protein